MTKKLFLLPFLLSFSVSLAQAADYQIDRDHSMVGFRVRHLTISTVTGRFLDFAGMFSFDPQNVAASKTDATIKVQSIDTDQAKRDEDLRSPNFFDAGKFGEMKFHSKEIKDISPEGFKVLGDLTIRDVTKPVVLDVKIGGLAKDPWGNERAAFSATAKISRKDFGMTYNKLLETGGLVVGDEVTINLEVEGIRKKG
jgi:polyisoprenoid-binding protein YceI